MNRRRFLTLAGATTVPLASGCIGDEEEQGEIAASVVMEGSDFDPVRAEIEVGEAVEWTNEDDTVHNVRSTERGDVEGDLVEWDVNHDVEAGESYVHTFREEGAYMYACYYHTAYRMCGAVLVGDPKFDGSMDCE